MFKTAPIALTVLLGTAVAWAQAPNGVFNPANGHTYLLTPCATDPVQARAAAVTMGGYLVAIGSRLEQEFLSRHFGGLRLWIGLSDATSEGTYAWDNGEPVTYTNWHPGEPNNSRATEDWVEIGFNRTTGWNDLAASGSPLTLYGLVEIETYLPTITPEVAVNAVNGHAYVRVAPGGSVFDAKAAAAALGGHLVAIDDVAEDLFLNTHFAGRRYWIGLSDSVTEGGFSWDNGQPLSYINWRVGEPNDTNGTEDFVRWGAEPSNGWVDVGPTAWNVAAGIAELPYDRAPFQTNRATAHLSADGIVTHGTSAARITKVLGTTFKLHIDTVGPIGTTLWDFGVQLNALRAGGSVVLPDGQIVNLDIAAAPIYWMSTGGYGSPTVVPWQGAVVLDSSAFALPGILSGQTIFTDPGAAYGVSFSQAVEIRTVFPGPKNLTLEDDAVTGVDLRAAPLGLSTFDFYGRTYDRFDVCSNGRVMFEQGTASFYPTINGAASEWPSINAWCDLDPSAGGTITVSRLGAVVKVDYVGVPYGGGGGSATFSIQLDTSVCSITLDGLSTFAAGGGPQFLGLSPGRGGVNPGPTPFALGAVAGPTGSNRMVYTYGPTGTLATGFNGISFTPAGPSYNTFGF